MSYPAIDQPAPAIAVSEWISGTPEEQKDNVPKIFDFGGAVPPWGRSAAEYEAFFALSDVPPSARILDCGSGPSSFAAEWSRNGRYVVAADPMYRFSARDFLADFDLTAAKMLAGMQKARDRFNWDYYGSPEDVVQRRRDVLTAFIADFQSATRKWSLRICLPTGIAFPVGILRSCTVFSSTISLLCRIRRSNPHLLPAGIASRRSRGSRISIV